MASSVDLQRHCQPTHSPVAFLSIVFVNDFRISLSFILPLSLTVKPAGALCSTEGELGGAEVGVATLTVIGVLQTLAPGPPDGVARGGAESPPEVAAGGKKLPQIAQAANRI